MDIAQIVFILYITIIPHILSECDWPANLRDSIWHDSDKGQLDFEAKTMSGLNYLVQNTFKLNTWDCMYYYQSSGILIMKSQDTVTLFATAFRPFQCIKLTAITNYSYYYYIQADVALRVGGERIMIEVESAVSTITETNAVSRLCNVSGTASDTEYHVLLKDKQLNTAAQVCPESFQDEFWYEVNDGGVTSCGSGNEHWDVCTDITRMEFDYSVCPTHIAYSSSGFVRCIATLTTGSSTLTTVVHTNSSTGYMFTCFMSKVSSTGKLLVSQSPRSCTMGQTPESQPQHPDGTKGLLLELTPHAISACDSATTTTTTAPETTTTILTTTTTTPKTTTTAPTVTSTTPTTTHTNSTAASTVSVATTTTLTTTSTTTTATSTTWTTTSTTTSTVTPTATSTTARNTPATTATTSPDDNTLIILAAVLSGVANFLIVILIVGIVLYIVCRRKRQTRPLPTT